VHIHHWQAQSIIPNVWTRYTVPSMMYKNKRENNSTDISYLTLGMWTSIWYIDIRLYWQFLHVKSIHGAFAEICQKDGRCRNKRKWSHFSLNSSKPKFKKMFTPRLKNLQFYYRSERHSTQSETRLLPNNAKRKSEHVESKLLTQYYQLKPACCVHQHTEEQRSGTNTVQRITEVN